VLVRLHVAGHVAGPELHDLPARLLVTQELVGGRAIVVDHLVEAARVAQDADHHRGQRTVPASVRLDGPGDRCQSSRVASRARESLFSESSTMALMPVRSSGSFTTSGFTGCTLNPVGARRVASRSFSTCASAMGAGSF
jgi:hypothetical protein